MVTIKASYTIFPNESTPKARLWLSDSDQVVRLSHAANIYIYKTNPNLVNIERMKDSLSKILVNYYPLAGRLCWVEGGRLELDCNAKGVVLLEAEPTKAMDEYGDFTPKDPIMDLAPKIDYTQPIEEIPLLFVQLTRFYGKDQGVAIGFSTSHPLVDGLTNIRFINIWAKVARGDTLDPDEMFPCLDRTVLKFPHPPLPPRFDHPELKPLPLMLGSYDHTEERKKKMTAVTLKLTKEQVEKLKKRANDQSQKDGSRPYSRFESIGAHIWKCASKARHLDDHQPSVVRFIVDVRKRLNPPLPQNYFGNAVVPTVTPACYVGELISNPLSYGAQKIREASDMLTNEYIRSQWDVVRSQEQMDSIRASFFLPGEHKKNSPFYGNPNLSVANWLSLVAYDADFGWGKPMYFGPAVVCPSDKAIIIRSPNEDGSVVISMHFQVKHMQRFMEFFWEDIGEGHSSTRARMNSSL